MKDKTKIITKEFLIRKLIYENLDTKTLSEQIGVHYSTIRSRARKYGIKKSKDQLVGAWQSRRKEKTGYFHPTQDPKFAHKYLKSYIKYLSISNMEYIFKSSKELSYALYLDNLGVPWDYRDVRIPYVNHFSGKSSTYVVDFSTDTEWISLRLNSRMTPCDKYLYAYRYAEKEGKKFRGISYDELSESRKLMESGYRSEFYSFS